MSCHNASYKLSSAPCGDMRLETVAHGKKGSILKSFQELEELENCRREILKRVEEPFWQILSHWTGTCIRALVLDWMIWIPMAIFCIIRLQARAGGNMPALAERLRDSDLDILGGFLSFLLVLFVNQTNSRFFEMYKLSKAAAGRIQDIAGLVSTQLPWAAAHRIVRHLNTAHVAGYVGLGGPYSKDTVFTHFNNEHGLLTKSELERVELLDMDSGSAAFKELCTWCQRDVTVALKSGHIDSYEATLLHNKILDFRAAMDGIYDYRDQPTPFFYIHFLCLLSVLYLPLFAVDNGYAAGWGEDSDLSIEVVNGAIVLLGSTFVVGLRLLGQIMVDPFGDDLEDLSVMTYISSTIDNCKIILESQKQPDVDDIVEEQLRMKSEPASAPEV
mmetsp:Transcript_6345/g.8254  ORF Transcript_6345/g.8254 Transcript_6345/m.8254 type:complete len:388 (-) Transcript_6345:23-1186(-)